MFTGAQISFVNDQRTHVKSSNENEKNNCEFAWSLELTWCCGIVDLESRRIQRFARNLEARLKERAEEEF